MSATAICAEPVRLRPDLSLGQLLTRAHEDVHAYGTADCPLCGGALEPHGVDAQCTTCGSRLG
jgi:hypothetical protein